MREKFELKVLWKTEDCYEMDSVTLLIVEEKHDAIRKAQRVLKENPTIDSIRIRIDRDCIASMGDANLGYGFVIVQGGDGLFFIGSDNFDSKYQVETETFELKGECPKDYFTIVHSGYQHDLEREEIQVHAGENGNVFLIKTEEGFIVDVYNQVGEVGTMAVWQDELDESLVSDFKFEEGEYEEFKKEWGQTHEEISACLGYDPDDDGTNEMIIGDGYFWHEFLWFPKTSSLYNPRQQDIADEIR